MAGYHKYVFDEKQRKFIGQFEKMYAAEGREGFDSWRQEDQRTLKNQICIAILNRYNFNNVLDVGCGKGTFTQLLKKGNNRVTGIDVSETAIRKAAIRFPDIDFECIDLTNLELSSLPFFRKRYDLILFMEVLSYLPNWEKVIEDFAKITDYMLILLFIPEDPMGFVKSRESLVEVCQGCLEVYEDVHLVKDRYTILFGKSLVS